MAAIIFQSPLLAIDEKQSKELAHALREVMKHHKIKINPKHVAYMQLAGVSASIYIPKAVAAFSARQAAKKQAAQSQGGTAVVLKPVPTDKTQETGGGVTGSIKWN